MSKEVTTHPGRYRREPLGLVWVCSDDPVLCLGFEQVLGPEMDLCCREEPPSEESISCVICPYEADVALKLGRIRSLMPDIPVLIYGLDIEPELARISMRDGASGYIYSRMRAGQIARAVSLAVEGMIVIPKGLLGEQVPGLTEPVALTPCQMALLKLVADGMTEVQIVRYLSLPEDLVRQCLTTACDVLGAPDRNEAVRVLYGVLSR